MNLKTILALNGLFFFILNISLAQTNDKKTSLSKDLYRVRLNDKGSISGSILEINVAHVILIKEGDTLRIPRKQIRDIKVIKNRPASKQSLSDTQEKRQDLFYNINGFSEKQPSILKSNLLIDNQLDISTGKKTRLGFQLALYPEVSTFFNLSLTVDLKDKKIFHPYIRTELASSIDFSQVGANDPAKHFAGVQGGLTIGTLEYFK